MSDVRLSDPLTLLAQARAARDQSDFAALALAADALLEMNPREPRALVLKADALAGRGEHRAAASFYGAALAQGRAVPSPSADLKMELERAARAQAEGARRFEQGLRDGLEARGFDPVSSSARFSASLDLMTGKRRLYYQQPKFYMFPGLPQIEFQPRDTVDWLAGVEAAGPAIRAELDAILAEPTLFAPYVEDRANRPKNAQAGMLDNAAWSAVFLWKDGAEVPEIAARCPETMKALAAAPLCRIPGRSPSILFSKLQAGARIPPHHGLINPRLICHLPLIAPPGSHFRVGGETREWREGQAWAFDDTIEHEAWNDSGRDRTILIFDVWKPEITAEEQDLIRALFAAIDATGGGAPKLGV
ncbi:asparaginyl beta-hydroxylase [Brevundimonas sp. MYb46]|nr:asparaginyl beta-hydroxylase [Brevundimonas sp. MYb31]PRA29977.1 asparaginyl beta-hydroxylase [Brevundimonas sp. MYb27]PRB14034.1 asparaginyl beta-hydroxylase [Brevundimonas sp. MYb52]PRB33299.1 asparaginyl beta-hydroxylase [Brevundimonas sp. MYb46]PRB50791.1 asparaginyl beta-hydroxylase [Brevundimonas sp. MYb33]